MKIAVLLTGRLCRFDEIRDRIKYIFDAANNSVDYFCHTWNDDFVDLKSATKLEDLYNLTIPTDPTHAINTIEPKGVWLSSNLEMLNTINDSINHINNPEFNLTIENILLYINYLAPQFSTYYAMQSLKSYVNETGTKYDVVIKWRYDLLSEKINFNHDIKINTLYTSYASEDIMDDRFYYGDYYTVLSLLDQAKIEFNKELLYTFYHMSNLGDVNYRKNVIERFNHAWFFNRMLLSSFKAVLPDLTIKNNIDTKVVIFRKYFNKNVGLANIANFTNRLFNHRYGWNTKVLSDEPVEITYREILVAGCSHVFGHGLPDCLAPQQSGGYQPSKFAWPHLLGEWSNSNIVNISKPGNSLGKIAYDILNYKNFKRLSGIIIILPTSERFLIRGDSEPVETFLIASKKYTTVKSNAVMNYLEHLQSDEINKVNYISQISYIVSMANNYNIPLWISAGSQADHDLLTSTENIPFSLNTEKSWYQYYVDHGYPLTPDRHLDIPAHTDFFENFIKPWVTKNILDAESQIFDEEFLVELKNVRH